MDNQDEHDEEARYKCAKRCISSLIVVLSIMIVIALFSEKKEKPDRSTTYGKAKYDVGLMKHEIHLEYLNCYPFAPLQKKSCTEKVANKYLRPTLEKDYEYYKQTVQFEAEKLGFKHFLNSKNLSCKSIFKSPIFEPRKEAYEVNCTSGEQYYMQFDYDNNQWSVK